MKKLLCLLLAMLLAATALAEGEVFAPPVDAPVEEVADSELWTKEIGEAAKYVSGNLAHFVHPSDGESLEPGEVEIWLTYDDDGLFDESGQMMLDDLGQIYRNYMPTYLAVEKDGNITTTTITNDNLSLNGNARRYATITLNEPGTYRLSVASSKGTGNPETITVTVGGGSPQPTQTPTMPVENPGYYLIPEKDDYTINLAYGDQVRFNFRLSLYREETNFWWGYGQEGDDILEMVDDFGNVSNGGEPLVLHEEDGRYVCDTHITYKATGVGTQIIGIAVYVNGAEYDPHTVTFHVIDDPGIPPEPTATPEPIQPSIADCEIAAIAAKTYTGKAIKPAPVVKYDGVKLVKGTDYTLSYADNVNAGTATVTVTGIGSFTGSAEVPFTIKPRQLSKAKIASIAAQAYTGKAIKPTPVVKYGSAKLVKGTDYTVSYKNNRNIGTATVTLKGKGNYAGSVKKAFKINPKPVAISKLTAGSQRLTVQWKKAAGGAGVQIQYSLKKSMVSAKTVTVTKNAAVKQIVRNLKTGKTYFVRIRGYKKVSGKAYASAWSKVKAVKVK